MVARRAHNPEVAGSNPVSATKAKSLEIVDNQRFRGFFFLYFILSKFREKRLKSRKNIKNASQMQVKNIIHSQAKINSERKHNVTICHLN